MGNDAPYGSESMTESQKQDYKKAFSEHDEKQMTLAAGTSMDHMKVTLDKSEERQKIRQVSEKANAQDTLLDRIKEFTRQSVKRSSWLSTYKVPKKAALDEEMSKAEETFGIRSMSKSQRTKRGKKFKEKAKLQAKMVSEVTEANWYREEALYDMMETESHKAQKDYLDNAAGVDPETALIMRDLSHYYRGVHYGISYEETDLGKQLDDSRQMEIMEDIVSKDKKTRDKAYERVLDDFLNLDLSQFDYSSDKEFVMGDGKNTFAKRYAALRAYSHVREIIKRCRLGTDYPTLNAKADTVQEILADYDRRALFLQSPYYALLAGKDVDSFSDEELRSRIEKTEDPYVKTYLEKMLENRQNFGFTKGRKAEDIFKEYFEPEKKAKKEEKKRAERDKEQDKLRKKEIREQENRKKILKAAADEQFEYKKLTPGEARDLCTKAPTLMRLEAVGQTKEVLDKRILELHNTANEIKFDPKSYDNTAVKWKLIDHPKVYYDLLDKQDRLNLIGQRVEALNEIKALTKGDGGVEVKGKVFSSAQEIDEVISSMTDTEEYKKLLEDFIKDLGKMEHELKLLR